MFRPLVPCFFSINERCILLDLRIEGISDDVIPGLEIPTGTPLVYELDKAKMAEMVVVQR